jgi:monoamine oxidase
VRQINRQKDEVQIVTDKISLKAKKVLITVSIGVLQSGSIQFSPPAPQIFSAVKNLGFGPVIKTVLQFDEAFWKNEKFTHGKDLSKLSFIFSRATIPTWWTYHPKNAAMLTGWSAGPHAEKIKNLSDKEILQKAMESLSEIFSMDVGLLQQKLKAWHAANWVNDPFSCGGYSYEVVNGTEFKQVLKASVENAIFFAGEGLVDGPEIGTVEAALSSGREMAHEILARLKT